MGGMFSVVKVREGPRYGDYKDPGWYKHPPARRPGNGTVSCPRRNAPSDRFGWFWWERTVNVRKGNTHHGH